MTSAPSANFVQPEMPTADDEIDLRQVLPSGCHKKLIAGIAGLAVLTSVTYAITLKPVWEGRLIVLKARIQARAAQLASATPS